MEAIYFLLHEEKLHRRTKKGLRLVSEINMRSKILHGMHDEIGHRDFDAIYDFITTRFWWSKIRPEVMQFVKSCDVCLKTNPQTEER